MNFGTAILKNQISVHWILHPALKKGEVLCKLELTANLLSFTGPKIVVLVFSSPNFTNTASISILKTNGVAS